MKHCLIILLILFSVSCQRGEKSILVRKGGDPNAGEAQKLRLINQSQISEQIFQIQKAKRYLSFLMNPPRETIQLQCLRVTPVAEEALKLTYDCLFETQTFSSQQSILAYLTGDELFDLKEKTLVSDNLKLFLRSKNNPEDNIAEFLVKRTWQVLGEHTEESSLYIDLFHSWSLSNAKKNPRYFRNEYSISQRLNFHFDATTKRLLSLEHPVRSQVEFSTEIRGNSPQKFFSGIQSISSTDRLLFKGPCSMPVGDWEFELKLHQTTSRDKGLLRVGEVQIQDRKSGRKWSTFNGCFSNYSRDWIDF